MVVVYMDVANNAYLPRQVAAFNWVLRASDERSFIGAEPDDRFRDHAWLKRRLGHWQKRLSLTPKPY